MRSPLHDNGVQCYQNISNFLAFENLRCIRDHQKLSIYDLSILASLSSLVEDVGQMAPSAVLAVVHGSHENTSTAL
jgi:hypothetical protein